MSLLMIGLQEFGVIAAGILVLVAVIWIANRIRGSTASKQ